MTVIALCSPVMGSGKTAAAQHLVKHHGFRALKFAAPLKDMTRALLPHLGVRGDKIEGYVEGKYKETPIDGFDGLTSRRIMQTLGTEWGREHIRPDLWTHITREAVQRCIDLCVPVVIDDMRFLNEFETVHALGGVCYRIVRPDAGEPVSMGHASEGELDRVAMPEIWNTGSLDDLYAALDATAEMLLRKSR